LMDLQYAEPLVKPSEILRYIEVSGWTVEKVGEKKLFKAKRGEEEIFIGFVYRHVMFFAAFYGSLDSAGEIARRRRFIDFLDDLWIHSMIHCYQPEEIREALMRDLMKLGSLEL